MEPESFRPPPGFGGWTREGCATLAAILRAVIERNRRVAR